MVISNERKQAGAMKPEERRIDEDAHDEFRGLASWRHGLAADEDFNIEFGSDRQWTPEIRQSILPDFESEREVPERTPEKVKTLLTQEMVKGASDITELYRIVRKSGDIRTEKGELPSIRVGVNMARFASFLSPEKMAALQASVILGQTEGEDNKELTKRLDNIPEALGLKDKAKELMEVEWKKYFVEHKNEVVEKAIAQASSVAELCHVIDKLKTIKIQGQGGRLEKEYVSADVNNVIKDVYSSVLAAVEKGGKTNEVEIEAKVREALPEAEVPAEYGIYKKAYNLIGAEVILAIKTKVGERVIREAVSVQQLGDAVAKFEVITDEDGVTKYEPAKVMDQIKSAEQILKNKVEAGDLREVDTAKIGFEVKSALPVTEVPMRYGIYNKAYSLIFIETTEAIKKKKFNEHISSSSQEGVVGGFLKKAWGGITGLFGGKKK